MDLEIVVVGKKEAGRRIPLAGSGKLTIGRDHANDLVLLDRGLSRHHCEIDYRPGGAELRDLGSANGTFVNGERIDARPLALGDRIALGDVVLEVRAAARAEPPPAPAPAADADAPTEQRVEVLKCVRCGAIYWGEDRREGRIWITPQGPLCQTCLPSGAEADAVRIGSYRLAGKIGEGGMGVVYEAWDEARNRRAAVKVLHASFAERKPLRDRFLQEMEVGRRLSHPNVIEVYEVGEVRGAPFIAMELFEGKNLGERLQRNRRLSLRSVLVWTAQAADGLAYAHSAGVIHRDVKPGNLLAADDDRVKILDFGLGRALDHEGTRLTLSGELIGTIAYASPEQLESSKTVDGRADIYGLGATLYHLVAGELPFQHDSQYSLMDRILTREPAPLDTLRPNLPPRLVECVHRAMRKDPRQRFQSALEMKQELARILV